MKQRLIPKPMQTQKLNFHAKQNSALHILEMSNDALCLYQHEFSYVSLKQASTVDADAYLAYDHKEKTLRDEILEQVRFSKHKLDEDVCEYLLSRLDGNGYFKASLKAICETSVYDTNVIINHLAILRTFEPHGCFAFSLAECLKIQCILHKEAIAKQAFMVCDYLEDVAIGDIQHIVASTALTETKVLESIHFIQSLTPKPAINYAHTASILHPECLVEVKDENIHVSLIDQDLCTLEPIDDTVNISVQLKKDRKKWETFLSLVEKRNITMLQVMQAITEVQRAFFIEDEALKTCTLEMISKKCGFHTSTVLRAISNKTCLFHKRYYPLKSFFMHGGNSMYTQAQMKERIAFYIEHENKQNPLSDEKLRLKLAEDGMYIARRTIMKYREQMFIFSSVKRKRRNK
ncbi:MAG: hypothetical protein ACK5KR_05085 [Breznakia sp.]